MLLQCRTVTLVLSLRQRVGQMIPKQFDPKGDAATTHQRFIKSIGPPHTYTKNLKGKLSTIRNEEMVKGRDATIKSGVFFGTEALFNEHRKSVFGQHFITQGFGNVGSWAAQLISAKGRKIVVVRDIIGTLMNSNGLAIPRLLNHSREHNGLKRFIDGDPIVPKSILVEVYDVFILAINHPTNQEVDEIRIRKGISIFCASTQNGSMTLFFASEAPWLTFIGSSTLDRKVTAIVHCHVPVCLSLISCCAHFKQWDPRKFVQDANSYNLEDKVALDGVGNVMILEIKRTMTQLMLEDDDSARSRRI